MDPYVNSGICSLAKSDGRTPHHFEICKMKLLHEVLGAGVAEQQIDDSGQPSRTCQSEPKHLGVLLVGNGPALIGKEAALLHLQEHKEHHRESIRCQ